MLPVKFFAVPVHTIVLVEGINVPLLVQLPFSVMVWAPASNEVPFSMVRSPFTVIGETSVFAPEFLKIRFPNSSPNINWGTVPSAITVLEVASVPFAKLSGELFALTINVAESARVMVPPSTLLLQSNVLILNVPDVTVRSPFIIILPVKIALDPTGLLITMLLKVVAEIVCVPVPLKSMCDPVAI